MGQINDLNKGLLTGLVGPVVFVKGKNGEAIVRSRPTPSARPPSAKKQQSWDKFALMSQFTKPIYPFLKDSFTDLLGKKTARDAVRSYYLAQVVTEKDGSPTLDYPSVLISTGRVRPYAPLTQQRDGQTLQLQWLVDTPQAFAAPSDRLTLMGYAPTTQDYVFFKDCATRGAGTVTLPLPDTLADTDFYLWATFSDADGEQYGVSTFLGEISSQ